MVLFDHIYWPTHSSPLVPLYRQKSSVCFMKYCNECFLHFVTTHDIPTPTTNKKASSTPLPIDFRESNLFVLTLSPPQDVVSTRQIHCQFFNRWKLWKRVNLGDTTLSILVFKGSTWLLYYYGGLWVLFRNIPWY